MALQFQHVFTGKRVWAGEPQSDTLIQSGAFGVAERQIIGVSWLRQFAKQGLCGVFCATAGNTQNADAAASRRGGLGYDGIGSAAHIPFILQVAAVLAAFSYPGHLAYQALGDAFSRRLPASLNAVG
ncbi:hypothetical protein D3C79_850590 [compost metagenome]